MFLNTFVEIRSDKFPPYDGEVEDIKPGLPGERFAEALRRSTGPRPPDVSVTDPAVCRSFLSRQGVRQMLAPVT